MNTERADTALRESHRAYVSAVAAALTQAGITVSDIDFFSDAWDGREPIRRAEFHVSARHTEHVYGHPSVRLAWTEEWGWIMPFKSTLCDQVIPTPPEVVKAVQAGLAALPPQEAPKPPYRSYRDVDNVMEDELDTYTQRADA
ncbi:hypothetical protein HTV80_31270 [Streptomyces sp. Vc74B-19]|uniref:DUF6292 family protein n=1 Tax=Streptomyces sp. Vc74B-19 TaxID=2741324 RepID=UPI001BFBF82D|nr:DUF6292 family protein [Streptomyces sp. Vc74B-19]MBT3167537.1 hypothetical protein [Streptomyces sp. Vc74B-19]